MIRLDQPRRWDLVGDHIQIAGIGTSFEATFAYRIRSSVRPRRTSNVTTRPAAISEGHDEVSSYIMAGGGTGEHAQFQVQVDVSQASFTLDRLFVEVFEASAKDGSELHKTTRPVLLGSRMVKGYYGYRLHEVEKGDTLIQLARDHYNTDDWHPIHRANVNELGPLSGAGQDTTIYPGQVLRIPVGSG